jgi:phospholipid/cholesterol/gamma-HCH transport system substrate-binding protein
MSQIDSFLDEGGDVIQQASRALGRVNTAFDEEAIADLQGILSNVNAFTAKLAEANLNEDALSDVLKAFERAANRVAETAVTIDVAAQDFDAMVNDDVKPLLAQAEITLRNVDTALSEYEELANDGSNLAVDARDAINRLSNSGVADLEETTDQLRRLIVTLNRVADGLERNPGQFLAGKERQTMELPQ